MKKIYYLVVPLTALLTSCASWHVVTYDPAPQPDYTNNTPVGYDNQPPAYDNTQPDYNQPQTDQVFYDELSPYGQWIDYPDYGYVWAPNEGPDFRPYASNGNWIYTEDGWTWFSDYSWGWAPFHYGRWFYDDYYGWLWEPGHEWAPAWVTWGQSGDYYGWAPIPPRVQYSGFAGYHPPRNYWNFVSNRNINRVNVNNYVVRNNVTVINNITNNVTIINNVTNNSYGGHRGGAMDNAGNNRNNNNDRRNNNPVVYNRGPQVSDVENVTRTRILPAKIMDNNRPGATQVSGNQFRVYRPAINTADQQNNNARPAPKRVQSFSPLNSPDRLLNHQSTVPQANPGSRPVINRGQNPNNQQQPQVNPAPVQNQNQNPNTRPNYQPRPQPQVNQDPVQNQNQNPNPRPNIQPRPQPQVNQDPVQNQNQNPNPRPNIQPRPQPQVNQDPVQNQNQNPNPRPNYQPRPQPQVNQDPVQNQNQNPNPRPNIQPRPQPQVNQDQKPAGNIVAPLRRPLVPVKKVPPAPQKQPDVQKPQPRPQVDK